MGGAASMEVRCCRIRVNPLRPALLVSVHEGHVGAHVGQPRGAGRLHCPFVGCQILCPAFLRQQKKGR